MESKQMLGAGVVAVLTTLVSIVLKTYVETTPGKILSKEIISFNCVNTATKKLDSSVQLNSNNHSVLSGPNDMHFGYWRLLDSNTIEIPTKNEIMVFELTKNNDELSLDGKFGNCTQINPSIARLTTINDLKDPEFVKQAKIEYIYSQILDENEVAEYTQGRQQYSGFYGPAPVMERGGFKSYRRESIFFAAEINGSLRDAVVGQILKMNKPEMLAICTAVEDSVNEYLLDLFNQYPDTKEFNSKIETNLLVMSHYCPMSLPEVLNVPKLEHNSSESSIS